MLTLNIRPGCLRTSLLSIRHEDPDVILTWCDPSGTYMLEATNDLTLPDSWEPVDLDWDEEAGVHTERVMEDQMKFFRLRSEGVDCPDCVPPAENVD